MSPWYHQFELRQMDWDELVELMEEPPGGHNHGRKRALSGKWARLGLEDQQSLDEDFHLDVDEEPRYLRPGKPVETLAHGLLSTYTNDRCRCPDCREAMREWKRSRRV